MRTESENVHLNISSSLYDGQDTSEGAFDFAVTVRSCRDQGSVRKCSECGGALLQDSNYVLTDLSCVDDNVDVSVLINGEREKVRRVINNEAAGVALLKLKETAEIEGLCYPPAGFCLDDKPATCVAVNAKGTRQQVIEPLSDRVCHRKVIDFFSHFQVSYKFHVHDYESVFDSCFLCWFFSCLHGTNEPLIELISLLSLVSLILP